MFLHSRPLSQQCSKRSRPLFGGARTRCAAHAGTLDVPGVPTLLRLLDSALPPPLRLLSPPSQPRLLTGYAETLSVLLSCIAKSCRGDSMLLRSYVIEEGESSRTVIAALRAAARRGVRLRLGCDRGLLSSFTRAMEGTDSLAKELALIALDFPESVTLEPGTLPDHSKVFLLASVDPRRFSAVLGGINLGDRFSAWTDWSLLLRGSEAVSQLAAALDLPPAFLCAPQSAAPTTTPQAISFAVNAPATNVPHWPLQFAARARMEGHWGVAPQLTAFYADTSLRSFTTATAYLDSEGCGLLQLALGRGARMRLVMPRAANVYAHCNARAIERLMRAPGSERLSVHLHGTAVEMMHAKVSVGEREDGSLRAYLGSANLKGRSLTQFGEVMVVAEGGEVAEGLAAGVDLLVQQGEEVQGRRDARIRYDPTVAACEEHCG